jgi:hypothetical protein
MWPRECGISQATIYAWKAKLVAGYLRTGAASSPGVSN